MSHISIVSALPMVRDDTAASRDLSGERRIYMVEAFLDRHVLPLHRLAGALAGEPGEALVERLVEIFSEGSPVASEITMILKELLDLFAEAPHQQIDDLAKKGVGGANLHAAINFYGARLTDLSRAMGQ